MFWFTLCNWVTLKWCTRFTSDAILSRATNHILPKKIFLHVADSVAVVACQMSLDTFHKISTQSTINTTPLILHVLNTYLSPPPSTIVLFPSLSSISNHVKSPRNFQERCGRPFSPTPHPDLTNSDTAPQPPTGSLPLPLSPRPTTSPLLTQPVQSESAEDLIAVSQEILANAESPKNTSSPKRAVNAGPITTYWDQPKRSYPSLQWTIQTRKVRAQLQDKIFLDYLKFFSEQSFAHLFQRWKVLQRLLSLSQVFPSRSNTYLTSYDRLRMKKTHYL